uniref:DUF751 family protein n=1 Tax=Cyanothece sp. (strain PCC 7425 / ATCC 29141) TaxID=395961 RepID=B8HWS0_CYAP4
MKDFWINVSRYPRYFITMLLGVFWNLLQPIAGLLKRPVTAIAFIGLVIGGLAFVSLTLRAMLGLPVS